MSKSHTWRKKILQVRFRIFHGIIFSTEKMRETTFFLLLSKHLKNMQIFHNLSQMTSDKCFSEIKTSYMIMLQKNNCCTYLGLEHGRVQCRST